VAGCTAYATVRAVELAAGDTVVVAGATGGVGCLAVQLAKLADATVIGVASPANRQWLVDHGVIPVNYGQDVTGRIKHEAGRIDAFIDTFGGDYVRVALDLGVQPARIDTIANFTAVDEYGVKGEGNAAGAGATVLEEVAALIAGGRLELPIAETFPLTQVKAAYRRLAQGHVLGKIVLVP
jgi:NADPH:quinone reductase-like Zn-dependent oxidoreductase